MLVFRKIWRALLSCYLLLRFALLSYYGRFDQFKLTFASIKSNKLRDQFLHFQLMNDIKISKSARENSQVNDEDNEKSFFAWM